MKITFLGATGTVTGSRYLIEYSDQKILVDCGLFQGLKELRLMNREPFPVDPKTLDAVLLTHAHLDHSGYIPRLFREGFKGPIYATSATVDLCKILLLDSASIQEEEARHAKRHGYSRHAEPEPLYTTDDATLALNHFHACPWQKTFHLPKGLEFSFSHAGHILGAASIHISFEGKSITFTGDVGRPLDPVLPPPQLLKPTDYLVIESTYGDRKHEDIDPTKPLAELIQNIKKNNSVLLMPAFAVGRTQSLLYQLWGLKISGQLLDIPIYVDSPMASDVTALYIKHSADHGLKSGLCQEIFGIANYIRTPEESKELSKQKGPMILLSASGMITGGRILHHLIAFGGDPNNYIAIAGYQAAGTRGAKLVQGDKELKIFGQMVPIRAQVVELPNQSAHADADELLAWLKPVKAPKLTLVTHGEPIASKTFCGRLQMELQWNAQTPVLGQEIEL